MQRPTKLRCAAHSKEPSVFIELMLFKCNNILLLYTESKCITFANTRFYAVGSRIPTITNFSKKNRVESISILRLAVSCMVMEPPTSTVCRLPCLPCLH